MEGMFGVINVLMEIAGTVASQVKSGASSGDLFPWQILIVLQCYYKYHHEFPSASNRINLTDTIPHFAPTSQPDVVTPGPAVGRQYRHINTTHTCPVNIVIWISPLLLGDSTL